MNMRSNWMKIGIKNPNETQKNQLNSSFTSYSKFNKLSESTSKLRVITPSINKKQSSLSRSSRIEFKQLSPKVSLERNKGSVETSFVDHQDSNRGTINSQKLLLETKQSQMNNKKSNINTINQKNLRQAIMKLKDFSKQIGIIVKESIKKMIGLSNQLTLKIQQMHQNYERELISNRNSLKQAQFQIFALKLKLQKFTTNKQISISENYIQSRQSIDNPKKQMNTPRFDEQEFPQDNLCNIIIRQEEIQRDILQFNEVLSKMKKILI